MEFENTTTTFKYGQKIYSKISLRSGIVTDIKWPDKSASLGPFITISRGRELGEETSLATNFTKDADVILEIMREQMEEYKESFFRVNNSLRNMRK